MGTTLHAYRKSHAIFALGVLLCLGGCQTPFLFFSGQALVGEEQTTESFAFAERYTLLSLEVRPRDPYSVILRVVMRDGELYIDAADRRRWHTYLKEDARVRVKLGDGVYAATAVRIEDPAITEQFLAGRVIYRIEPRPSASN